MIKHLWLVIVLLSYTQVAFSSPVAIRRAASLVEKVIQKSKNLKLAQTEFEKEIDKLLSKQLSTKPLSNKRTISSADSTLASIESLMKQDPMTAQTNREELATILGKMEDNLQELVVTYKQNESTLQKNKKDLSRANQYVSELKTAGEQGKETYMKTAQRILADISQIIEQRNISGSSDVSAELDKIFTYMHHNPNLKIGWLEKSLKGNVQKAETQVKAQAKLVEKQQIVADKVATLLDLEQGRIAKIRKELAELDEHQTQQALEELLQEHAFDLNIQTADSLLKHAKGHALSIAEENGVAQLDLDNGIKDILNDHIDLDGYKVEKFSLEDLEVALRTFTPDEEIAFKEALGTNWRQYLFVIENSKTRDGEHLLSLADIRNDEFLQDFIANYLDNIDTIVPEYQHRLPDNLLSAALHKHANNYTETLQYSKVYSQQIGELKAKSFLKKQTESFTKALEDLKNANDEDRILELYDEPEKELILFHKATMAEVARVLNLSPENIQDLAMIRFLNRSVESANDIKLMKIQASLDDYLVAVDINNIRQSYVKNLLALYRDELDDNAFALNKTLSMADAKLANIDKNFNKRNSNQQINYRTSPSANGVEFSISSNKLEKIRDIISQEMERYKELDGLSLKTTKEVKRKYEPLGWELDITGRSNHAHLTNKAHKIGKVQVPRTKNLRQVISRKIFRKTRGLQVVNNLVNQGVLPIDDLKKFMVSKQYMELEAEDDFIKKVLDPTRKIIGINE